MSGMIVVKRKWIPLLVIDALLLVWGYLNPDLLRMILVLVVWSNGFIFTLEDLETRGALFAFLSTFFLFLIGREALEVFGLHDIEIVFSRELNQLAEGMLLISLLSLFIGYVLAGRITFKRLAYKTVQDYQSQQYISVRHVSKILFLLTFAFNIFTLTDIVLFVLRNGYLAYYTSYVSSVPYVIKKIGDMCPVCLWIFFATMPEKRAADRLSMLYMFYLLLTLGTGKRFPFAAGILTLFVYYISRNTINPGKGVWVKKRTLVALFIMTPFLFMGLYVVGQIRFNHLVNSVNLGSMVGDFLYKQGVSVNIIKRTKLYVNRLPAGKMYLFGSTYEAISNNIIFRSLGARQYAGNNIAHALGGYSFQHALSYAAMGNYYLEGHGLGSCYIAEVFHDLGYVGVVIVNVIYGILFRRVFNFKNHGIWMTAIIISMLNSLLLAPRGSADGFITDIVDLTTWGTILVVWMISKTEHRRYSSTANDENREKTYEDWNTVHAKSA
ncbi:MAG: O-antigen polysaccharide polymerase Wzy [Sarcina sp.]|nr:O-antigen polysaccharide polymerase Wzy [Sarcina sp.]